MFQHIRIQTIYDYQRVFFILFASVIILIAFISNSPILSLINAQINVNSSLQNNDNNITKIIIPINGNNSFKMSGPVSSFIHTQNSDWVVGGNWNFVVKDGNLTNFLAHMKWDPTNTNTSNVKTHYHDFSFFRANPSQNIVLGSKNQTQINGIMDVGLGLQSHNWRNVPAQINTAGNTIKISFDDSKTGGHFDTDYVFGEITDLVNLSSTTDNKTNIIKNPIDNKTNIIKNPIDNKTKLLNVKL